MDKRAMLNEKRKIMLIAPWHDFKGKVNATPPHLNIVRYRPPVGLLTLGAVLLQDGFEVDIIDTRVMKNYKELIKEKLAIGGYLFIGITVSLGIDSALKKAEEIQRYCRVLAPEVPFVWGGFFPSCMPEETLNRYKPDYIIRFDGEETIRELAASLLRGKRENDIKGVSYKLDNRIINNPPRVAGGGLDDYPVPAWHLIKEYLNREQVPYYATIISSLGCPYDCSFCYYRAYDNPVQARKWRGKSTGRLMEELNRINELSGINVFTFEDDNFLVDKERAMEIFERMRKKGFYAEKIITNLSHLDGETMDAMKGIVNEVVCSVETTSERLRAALNKNINPSKIETMNKELFKRGINMTVGFMFGLPLEDDQDRKTNVDFMKRLKKINPFMRASVTIFKPLPKTDILKFIQKEYGNVSFICESYCQNYEWGVDSDFAKNTDPYFIDKAEQSFIVEFAQIFRILFSPSNSSYRGEIEDKVEKNPRLKAIFGNLDEFYWTDLTFKPYLLDRILKGERVDLPEDLEKQARGYFRTR